MKELTGLKQFNMDKKYFIKGTNIQVVKGGDLKLAFDKITAEDLELLTSLNVLEVKEESYVQKAIEKMGLKTGLVYEDMESVLYTIGTINPWNLFQLLLKQVAILMDKKYPDHISKSDHLFYISNMDNQVHELIVPRGQRNSINYSTISLFRSKEEAETALREINKYLDYLQDEQED